MCFLTVLDQVEVKTLQSLFVGAGSFEVGLTHCISNTRQPQLFNAGDFLPTSARVRFQSLTDPAGLQARPLRVSLQRMRQSQAI